MVDGVLFVAAAGIAARKLRERGREFQVDQFMDHGELHVIKHVLEWHAVISRVEYADDGRLLIVVPVDIAEGFGLEIALAREDDGDVPLPQSEASLPEPKLLGNKALGDNGTFCRRRSLRVDRWCRHSVGIGEGEKANKQQSRSPRGKAP